MTCREKFVRRMPGRIAGQTNTESGKRCWVLTLQTREQHIRREKATSNICTNQGLFALRASIYLALMGPEGMSQAAELCVRKSHYAADRITSQSRFSLAYDAPYFKEFVVRDNQANVKEALSTAEGSGYMPGVWLGQWYPDLEDAFLVAVTEKRTQAEIDGLASALAATQKRCV